jgi:hypothetical protein
MYLPVEAVPVMVALMSSLPSLLLFPLFLGFYYVVADTFFTLEDGTQIVYFYGEQSIVSTESSVVETSDDQSFYDAVTSNMDIVAALCLLVPLLNHCQLFWQLGLVFGYQKL